MTNQAKVERVSDRELVVTRTFGGPPAAVFEAWTKPEVLKKWWAPRSMGVTLFICESDLRTGGAYRYVFGRDPKDPEIFTGHYDEVVPGKRLVFSQVYERFRDAGAAIVTATFDEHDGRTLLTLRQVYPSKEALDGAIASGMERGTRITLDQLDDLLRAGR